MSGGTRFPFRDLEARLGDGATQVIADRLAVSTRTVWRWRTSGLTTEQADRAAVAAG